MNELKGDELFDALHKSYKDNDRAAQLPRYAKGTVKKLKERATAEPWTGQASVEEVYNLRTQAEVDHVLRLIEQAFCPRFSVNCQELPTSFLFNLYWKEVSVTSTKNVN